MPYSEDTIKKMLPKVRNVSFIGGSAAVVSCTDFSSVCLFFCLFSFKFLLFYVLKIYLRKCVAHEINVALTYFRNLVPVMDKYGKVHSPMLLNFVNSVEKGTLHCNSNCLCCVLYSLQ